MAPTVCLSDMPEGRPCRMPFEYFLQRQITQSNKSTNLYRKSWTRNCSPQILKLKNLVRVEGSMGVIIKDLSEQLSRERSSHEKPVMCNEISRSCDIKSCCECNKRDRLLVLKKREDLLDITLRTMLLIKRNRQLQNRLTALQAETRAFVDSVLNNPENQNDSEFQQSYREKS